MSVLRFARKPRAKKPWPSNLPPPVMAMDNRNREIAVSALCNLATRDGERIYSCDLTDEQAKDIAAWFLLRTAV